MSPNLTTHEVRVSKDTTKITEIRTFFCIFFRNSTLVSNRNGITFCNKTEITLL